MLFWSSERPNMKISQEEIPFSYHSWCRLFMLSEYLSVNLFLNIAFWCVHVSREDISNLASYQMAYKVEFIQHESAVQLPCHRDSWILRQRCLSTFLKGFTNARCCCADNQHSPLPSGRVSVSERHRQTSKCLPPSKVMKEASVLFDHTARASSLR